MAYVKITNGSVAEYPYSVGQLRRDNPNTSFPKSVPEEMMAAFDMFPVGYEAAPDYDPMTHRVEHSNMPVLKDGKWVLTKTLVALTAEEIQARDDSVAADNRARRDALLAATDYLALTDTTLSAEMASYRQALRDITVHANWPHLADGDWPTKP